MTWLGRVALARRPARGRRGRSCRRCARHRSADGRAVDVSVGWAPALVDEPRSRRWPPPCPVRSSPLAAGHRSGDDDRRARRGRRRHRQRGRRAPGAARPRPRPSAPPAQVAEAFTTRLDGSHVPRPGRPGRPGRPAGSTSGPARSPRRAGPGWSCSSTRPTRGDAWFLSVLGPGADGQLLPVEVALGDSRTTTAAGRRAGPPRAPAPGPAPSGRAAPRPGRA